MTTNFNQNEFTCPCGCFDDRMSMNVIYRLEVARQLLGRAISISSGVRCPKHNEIVGGSPASSHLVMFRDDVLCACAIDIKIEHARDAFDTIRALLSVGFTRIGLRSKGDRRFIHADLDYEKAQNVMWTYNEPTLE